MIIGIGIDLVDLERIALVYNKFGERFLRRILSPAEMAGPLTPAYIGSRFAVKEATVKALGTGFTAGITPVLVEVVKPDQNRPTLILRGAALKKAEEIGARRFHVSLSHERKLATAMVILED